MLFITENKNTAIINSSSENTELTKYRIKGFLGYGGNGNVVNCEKIVEMPIFSRQSTTGSTTPPTTGLATTNFPCNSDYFEDVQDDVLDPYMSEIVFKI